MNKKSERHNEGKPQLSLIPLDYLYDCAKVLEFGAKKYSRDGHRLGFPQNEIIDSLLRHISDLQQGKVLDEESGLSIIGHIQCNALFLGNKNNNKESVKITGEEYTIYEICEKCNKAYVAGSHTHLI